MWRQDARGALENPSPLLLEPGTGDHRGWPIKYGILHYSLSLPPIPRPPSPSDQRFPSSFRRRPQIPPRFGSTRSQTRMRKATMAIRTMTRRTRTSLITANRTQGEIGNASSAVRVPGCAPHCTSRVGYLRSGRTYVFTFSFACFARSPTLLLQFRRRSVEGLSMLLFVMAFVGNSLYVSSILISPSMSEPGYLLESLPYLLGSGASRSFGSE